MQKYFGKGEFWFGFATTRKNRKGQSVVRLVWGRVLAFLTACENGDQDAEDLIEDTEEAVEDAGEAVGETAEDGADAVEDAADEY